MYKKIVSTLKQYLNNPVYLKDIRQLRRAENKNYLKFQIWIVYVCVLLFFAFNQHNSGLDTALNLFPFFIFFQTVFYSIRGGLRAYPLFIKEKEQRTLGGLSCTLLTSKDIVTGKFLTAFNDLALELTYFLPLLFLLGFLTKTPLLPLVAGYLITLINLAIGVLIGLNVSLKASSRPEARSLSVNSLLYSSLIQFHSVIGFLTTFICSLICTPGFDKIIIDNITKAKNFFLDHIIFDLINPFNSLTTLIFFSMQKNQLAIPFHPIMILFYIYVFVLYALLIRFFYGRTVKLLDKTMNMDNPVPERV